MEVEEHKIIPKAPLNSLLLPSWSLQGYLILWYSGLGEAPLWYDLIACCFGEGLASPPSKGSAWGFHLCLSRVFSLKYIYSHLHRCECLTLVVWRFLRRFLDVTCMQHWQLCYVCLSLLSLPHLFTSPLSLPLSLSLCIYLYLIPYIAQEHSYCIVCKKKKKKKP